MLYLLSLVKAFQSRLYMAGPLLHPVASGGVPCSPAAGVSSLIIVDLVSVDREVLPEAERGWAAGMRCLYLSLSDGGFDLVFLKS